LPVQTGSKVYCTGRLGLARIRRATLEIVFWQIDHKVRNVQRPMPKFGTC